jgi:hypothetical protein
MASSDHGIFPDSFSLFALKSGVLVETLTGTTAMTTAYPSICKLDPGGASRDITLEAETAEFNGLVRLFVNAADAAENLVCKDADGNTIATINQNEAGLLFCGGTAGWALVAIWTIALS